MRRLGILGTAKVAQRVVVQPGLAEVVAVASRSLARAQAAIRHIPGARALRGYQALLDQPDVEAVYLALPPAFHAPWAAQAAGAGKHVLVEKPLARTAAEIDRITASARATNVAVLEAMPLDFHPWPAALIEPGPAETLECRLEFAEPDADNYRRDLTRGGGIFWDAAPYFAALVDVAFGAPAFKVLQARAWGWESFSCELELSGGRQAKLLCAFGGSHIASVRVTGPAGAVDHQSFLRPIAGAFQVNLHHVRPDGVRITLSFPPTSYAEAQLAAFLAACAHGFDAEAMARARRRTAMLEAVWQAAGGGL